MKQSKIFLCFLLLSSFTITILAQNVIPSTGGNANGNGGSVSYTVGQIASNMLSGTNGTATQGVQQPYEISAVTSVDEVKDINLICSVYPNPTTGFLILKVANYENNKFSYCLYGVTGNLIETKKVLANETQISMGNLVSGSYFLKINSGSQEIKTFKIIKN